jgi:predicted PurR-regulated permease PerM
MVGFTELHTLVHQTRTMQSNEPSSASTPVIRHALQLLALGILLTWCFFILEPFRAILVWAVVLSITLYPMHLTLTRKLKGRENWSAILITSALLLVIILPSVLLVFATVEEFRMLTHIYKSGKLHIPPPPESTQSLPAIGPDLYRAWKSASTDLTGLLGQHTEQVKSVLLKFFELLSSTGKGILQLTLAIVASGFLLVYGKSAGAFANPIFVHLAGDRGTAMADAVVITVRNVAKGVLGVAVIQSMLAGFGFVLAGVPFAGVWILICLILGIVQIGILPVSIGVIIYIWGAADTLTAALLTAWIIFVGVIDNVLKPIFMGKGAPVPALVVFMGSLGGFMLSGFIGLFIGAIILMLGYKLIVDWTYSAQGDKPDNRPSQASPE